MAVTYDDPLAFQAALVGYAASPLRCVRDVVTRVTCATIADSDMSSNDMACCFFGYVGILPQSRVCIACGEVLQVVPTERTDSDMPLQLLGNAQCAVCGAGRHARYGLSTDSFLDGVPFRHYSSFLEFLMMWALEYPYHVMNAELPDVHPNTISQWKTYVQELCMLDLECGDTVRSGPIGGLDAEGNRIRVQADETLLNKRKPSRLTRVARPQRRQLWLWGAVEEGNTPNFVFEVLKLPEDAADGRPRGKKELRGVIQRCIRPGTELVTDSWKAYMFMDWHSFDIAHLAVNHAREFVTEAGDHTNNIEAHWSVLKRWLRKRYNGRLPQGEDFYLYLWEFAWRKKINGSSFAMIVGAMAKFYGEELPFGETRQSWIDAMRLAADSNDTGDE